MLRHVEVVAEDSVRLRARGTRLIFGATALGTTSLYAAFTVAPLLATEWTGSRSWSGVPGAVSIGGAAVGAALLSAVMIRRGRAVGLRLGYVIGSAGAVGSVVAAAIASFPLLVAMMLLIGIGHTSNHLARFAAADLHPPARRATVLGWVVWASTIGAAAGPSLPRPLSSVAGWLDLPPEAAGLLIAVACFVAALTLTSLLRAQSGASVEDVAGAEDIAGAEDMTLRSLVSLTHVRAALVAMLIAQTAMVLVMTMTPVHVRDHGHGLGTVGLVMSAHFVGMFALAPLVGKIVVRVGAMRVMIAGLVGLMGSSVGAGLTPGEHHALGGLWLFGLGLGWCLTFVAGSSSLAHGLPYRARVKVQGSVDTLSWTAGAVASLGSGVVLERYGFETLALVGAGMAVVTIVYLRALARVRGPIPAEP